VFNLTASPELARARIAREDLGARVNVVEGDFLTGELPAGFDRVLFSRVLADWEVETSQMLVKKARAALVPGGTLVICEPFVDENEDLAMSWQFRYIFYDDFGVDTYKCVAQYRKMIDAAGFAECAIRDRAAETMYGVITAVAPGARTRTG
jgi:hypothetical protein